MRIEYRRNLMTNYMVIEQVEEPEAWELEMMMHCKVVGIIFAEQVKENEQAMLWYNISGKQSLDTILESKDLNYELLCTLLMGIYNQLRNLEDYLLSPGGLLLQPECIFVDYPGKEVFFCYCSGYEKALPAAFCDLLEYCLTHLDHEDDAAVTLAYHLYEEAARDGFSIRQLQNLLHITYEKESQEDVVPTAEKEQTENTVENIENKDGIITPLFEIKRCKIIQKITEIWGKVFQQKEMEQMVFEPEEEQEKPVARPTVLLSELKKEPEGILRYEGTGMLKDMEITQIPFVIGSDTTCEGCISSNTVSRMHAKITKTEDIYFIEDLNSTNGTCVGGEFLNYRTKVSLGKNDIVVFADEKFRFI